jgi:F-type H+-transporting ATPase subunit c
MLATAKYIGAGLACSGLIVAGAGIESVFSLLNLSTTRNPQLKGQFFNYAILGFALAEAIGLFALMMGFLFAIFLTLLAIIRLLNLLKILSIIKLGFILFFIIVNIILIKISEEKYSQIKIEYLESTNIPGPLKNAMVMATGAATFYGTYLAHKNDTQESILNKRAAFLEAVAAQTADKEASHSNLKDSNLSKSLGMQENFKECSWKMQKLGDITGQIRVSEEALKKETDSNKKSLLENDLINYHKEQERLRLNINSILQKQEEINNALIKTNLEPNSTEDKIQKSSIIDFDFLLGEFEKLSVIEKMACCFVISGGAIFSCILSIILTIYGDYLLDKFKLEQRYPKLANIIKLRKKLHNYYLKINIFWIVIIGLGNIIFGLMMFYG